jgi:hypothetical protein
MAAPRVSPYSAQAQSTSFPITMLLLWQQAHRLYEPALLCWRFRKLSLSHELWWLMSASMPKRNRVVGGAAKGRYLKAEGGFGTP